jgi:hypothetical protein
MAAPKRSEVVPIRDGHRYRRTATRKRVPTTSMIFAAAALVGTSIGIGSTAFGRDSLEQAAAALKPFAVSAGFLRARAPQEGDHWSRCDEARTAGSAPIYAGEPGYRDGLDGDGDGIACEPYRGQ